MSTTKLEQKYRCWNDCLPSGCPGHVATLEFQSVSNALHFTDGKGTEIYMQTPELEALLCMVQALSKCGIEIKNSLEMAFSSEKEE